MTLDSLLVKVTLAGVFPAFHTKKLKKSAVFPGLGSVGFVLTSASTITQARSLFIMASALTLAALACVQAIPARAKVASAINRLVS